MDKVIGFLGMNDGDSDENMGEQITHFFRLINEKAL